ncbi:hypothetical protein MMC18_001501 [Xylographa bjoerkii]|nr:hypothetical protein [Xylographa bjoerkii]
MDGTHWNGVLPSVQGYGPDGPFEEHRQPQQQPRSQMQAQVGPNGQDPVYVSPFFYQAQSVPLPNQLPLPLPYNSTQAYDGRQNLNTFQGNPGDFMDLMPLGCDSSSASRLSLSSTQVPSSSTSVSQDYSAFNPQSGYSHQNQITSDYGNSYVPNGIMANTVDENAGHLLLLSIPQKRKGSPHTKGESKLPQDLHHDCILKPPGPKRYKERKTRKYRTASRLQDTASASLLSSHSKQTHKVSASMSQSRSLQDASKDTPEARPGSLRIPVLGAAAKEVCMLWKKYNPDRRPSQRIIRSLRDAFDRDASSESFRQHFEKLAAGAIATVAGADNGVTYQFQFNQRKCVRKNKSPIEILRDEERNLPCTMKCGKKFKDKHRWKIHEENNYPPDLWVCPHPDCANKSPKKRIKTRKDHFKTHLAKAHGEEDITDEFMEACHHSIDSRFSRVCLFNQCDKKFTSWKSRNDHLVTKHFSGSWKHDEWRLPEDEEMTDNVLITSPIVDTESEDSEDQTNTEDSLTDADDSDDSSHDSGAAPEFEDSFGTGGNDSQHDAVHERPTQGSRQQQGSSNGYSWGSNGYGYNYTMNQQTSSMQITIYPMIQHEQKKDLPDSRRHSLHCDDSKHLGPGKASTKQGDAPLFCFEFLYPVSVGGVIWDQAKPMTRKLAAGPSARPFSGPEANERQVAKYSHGGINGCNKVDPTAKNSSLAILIWLREPVPKYKALFIVGKLDISSDQHAVLERRRLQSLEDQLEQGLESSAGALLLSACSA